MKKEHTIEELKQKADNFFKAKPAIDKVYVTLDGNVFTMYNRAKLHAGINGKVYPFVREMKEGTEDKADVTILSAKDTISKIKEVTTLDALKPFVDDERKTVIEALKAKTIELEATINNDNRN